MSYQTSFLLLLLSGFAQQSEELALLPKSLQRSGGGGVESLLRRTPFPRSRLLPLDASVPRAPEAESEPMVPEFNLEGDEDEPFETRPKKEISNMEKAWRFAKKPLLRIGSKGAQPSHGNSLKELLEQHVVVKVKINTWKLGKLEEAFEVVRKLAEDAGAPSGCELLRTRASENTILIGRPGISKLIEAGEFPPSSTN